MKYDKIIITVAPEHLFVHSETSKTDTSYHMDTLLCLYEQFCWMDTSLRRTNLAAFFVLRSPTVHAFFYKKVVYKKVVLEWPKP